MPRVPRGAQERTQNDGTFYVIKHNCICQESKHEREGFEPVEVVNPQTRETSIKFIKRYQSLDGFITRIEYRDTEQQFDQRYVSWKIHLSLGGGRRGVLEIPFQSRMSSRFMKLAENIDFTEPVEFRAWKDTKTDSTAFYVGQGDDGSGKTISVRQLYTKDDPDACPPPRQAMGGKWNFDDQMTFLHDQMMNVVIPRVEAAAGMLEEHAQNGDSPADDLPPYTVNDSAPDDDIPF